MKLRNKTFLYLPLVLSLLTISFYGCKKDSKLTSPDPMGEFPAAAGTYLIVDDPGSSFKIPVGISNVTNADRVLTFSVSSPTGAVEGQHYTLEQNGSITIPAGTALDSITVKGNFAAYPTGRKDTLVFTITGGDVGVFPGYSTYKLVMQKLCPVDLNALLGDYDNTNELFGANAYGPYTTSISSVIPLTATSGQIVVENIYDYGWNPITFNVNWSDPLNVKVTLDEQSGIGNAGTLSSAYAGEDVSVRAFAGQTGSLSACDQKIVLKLQVGITGIGWYTDLYTVTLQR